MGKTTTFTNVPQRCMNKMSAIVFGILCLVALCNESANAQNYPQQYGNNGYGNAGYNQRNQNNYYGGNGYNQYNGNNNGYGGLIYAPERRVRSYYESQGAYCPKRPSYISPVFGPAWYMGTCAYPAY